jgi:hypothetical protein
MALASLVALFGLPPPAQARIDSGASGSAAPGKLVIFSAGPGTVRVKPDDPDLSGKRCQFTGDPAGRNSKCPVFYPIGTRVKLIAVPDPHMTFFRWGDFQCLRELTCRVRVTTPADVGSEQVDIIAIFNPVPLRLDIGGAGIGSVDIRPLTPRPGCAKPDPSRAECIAWFPAGMRVNLVARSDDSVLWKFGCRPVVAKPKQCFARTHDLFVGVRFGQPLDADDPPFPAGDTVRFRVYKAGRGTVTGLGISCGRDCTEVYNMERQITLRARPARGWHFRRWILGCGRRNPCSLSPSSHRTVQAVFSR